MRAECFIFCFNDRSEFYKIVKALKRKFLSWYFACRMLLGIPINDISVILPYLSKEKGWKFWLELSCPLGLLSILKKFLHRCKILMPILLINARFESLTLNTIVIDFELIFENGNDIAFFDPPTFLWESCLRSPCKFYTPISYGYEFRQNQW